MHLNLIDYGIIGTYFAISLLVGWLVRRKATSATIFLHASRSLPTAVTTIAFVAANCGALEIVGIASASAKYGAKTLHFYWIGAIPAMLFLALFMMPTYISSSALTVPEFLKLRYNEATRQLSVFCSGIVMILVSGISLYAMSEVLGSSFGWSFTQTAFPVAAVVFLYVMMGGLTATIYNELLQFLLILVGLLPLTCFILRDFQGLSSLLDQLSPTMRHTWTGVPLFSPASPLDVIGIVMGLGFVLSFGYWCTDFLLIQRALAARSVSGARSTPLWASLVKIFFPALVVLPGLAAAVVFRGQKMNGYDQTLPRMMMHYYQHGLLGLGFTAILASLMSGLAGNISAVTTIWTHDIYRASFAPNKNDMHYVSVGRLFTLLAVLLSIATAYLALTYGNIMDYLQFLFSLFNAPLLATFLLGMFTTWVTPQGGFWGLLIGIFSSIAHGVGVRLRWIGYGSDMSANFYGAIIAFVCCMTVTLLVSCVTPVKPPELLANLTAENLTDQSIRTPRMMIVLAMCAALICIAMSILFR
ncbi:sodium:solute symporter family transporter [Edaphobacter albus]|uniref:sodium:solute symporter family transporter n=1 Tax=Edaphobacter sp. 4G125 TaxID=2763071 RepID=UPI0016468E79|nr:sodium/solute symporter [Edaphobacter sp. 4G125]QNI36048.1 sodium/solute symporter [Edaphobacter sp. 4G125]